MIGKSVFMGAAGRGTHSFFHVPRRKERTRNGVWRQHYNPSPRQLQIKGESPPEFLRETTKETLTCLVSFSQVLSSSSEEPTVSSGESDLTAS